MPWNSVDLHCGRRNALGSGLSSLFGELVDLAPQDRDLLTQQPQLLLLRLDLGAGFLGVLGGRGELFAGSGQLGQSRLTPPPLLTGLSECLTMLFLKHPETRGGLTSSQHRPRSPLLGLGPGLYHRPEACGCFLGTPHGPPGPLLSLLPRLLDRLQARCGLFTPTLRLRGQ
ncbi:hypothetical protein [Streptomyces sp. NPDC127038]|uniref:hypothetical protein n=1 Tax=Streptomyces sp. NPDC127038 TaxID=3347114 RepID=UPI00364B0FCC